MTNLNKVFNKKFIILDGAMGTSLQKKNLSESQFQGQEFKNWSKNLTHCFEALNISNPTIIEEIHLNYLEAGANIIRTNTFQANFLSLKKYGLENYTAAIIQNAVQIAKSSLKKLKKYELIAGTVGPIWGDFQLSDVQSAYYQQIHHLLKNQVDLLIIETIFDLNNGLIALRAALEAQIETHKENTPIILSFNLNQQGQLLSGHSIEEFISQINLKSIQAIGINCVSCLDNFHQIFEKLQHEYKIPIIYYPNLGVPDQNKNYMIKNDQFLNSIESYLEKNYIQMIGGCCGTDHTTIKSLSDLINRKFQ